jgi:MYXO-CTERM domain-containing protein
MSNRAIVVTSLSAWLFAVSSVAAAAPPPTVGGGGSGPEQEACSGRAVGDACTLPNRALGTCGQGTCNRLDYSQGSPPKAIEEACVVCQPSQGHGNGPALGTGGAPPDGSADGADGTASSDSAASKEPPQSESRCRIDATREPVGLAGLVALLLLAGVRRRRA